jgi:ubiquinone/menaquinone biosynthesis C-methylase UbiE
MVAVGHDCSSWFAACVANFDARQAWDSSVGVYDGAVSSGTTPDTYTHGHQESVLRSHRWRTAENSAAYLLPFLAPGLDVLDVGCGPGSLTIDLAKRTAPGQMVGIDLSASVIAEATEAAEAAGAGNVSFRVGDFRSVGFQPATFDVVHAHQVLQHLSDPVGALAAMRGLVRAEGIVAARESDYSAMTWAPSSPYLDRWLEIYLAVTRRNGAEADAGRWLLAWTRQAGCRDITYTSSTWTFATDDSRRWWSELWAERTVGSSLAEQAVAYGIATPAELAEVAAGWREWGRDPAAVFIVPHGEIIARP